MEVYSDKVELKVSAKRVWKGFFEDAHSFLPKASPHAIEKIEYEGTGFEAGSVRTVHLHKSHAEKIAAEKNTKVVLIIKEKLEHVDHAGLKLKGSIIEGGFLGVLVKKYDFAFRVVETGPDCCTVEWKFDYEPLSAECAPHVPAALKDAVPVGFKDAEAYLLAHPDLYN